MRVRADTEQKDAAQIMIKKVARAAIYARVCCALTVAANASAVTLFPAVKEI